MKIGILNFHFANNNYGAVLQAAALHDLMTQWGNSVETIDLDPYYQPKSFKGMLRTVKKSLFACNELYIKNSKVFEEFRQQWLPRSTKYLNLSELQTAELSYEAIVVGSDQVWRPHYTKSNYEAYFLSFAKPEVKKIAYAASFGVDHWELSKNDPVTLNSIELARKFDAVSVRESSGKTICKEVFDIDAELVLDPTLLVGKEFFEKIIGESSLGHSEEKNVVYYKLDADEEFTNGLKTIGENLSTAVENIYYKELKNSLGSYNSIPQWLKKIKESKLVVTDSFHCTCFAILFEKPFLYYGNELRGFARVESLFALLGIDQDRVLWSDYSVSNITTEGNVNYSVVTKRLSELRESSMKFLKDALNK